MNQQPSKTEAVTEVTAGPANVNVPQTAPSNPGKGLAIAGIILAFVFQLLGLILSIVAYNKSKKARSSTTLATTGIVLNSVFMALTLILVPIFVGITMTAYSGIQSRAKTASASTAALSVLKKTEAYAAINNAYPTTVAELNAPSDSNVTSIAGLDVHLATTPLSEDSINQGATTPTIELYACDGGNKIGYWDYTTSSVQYLYTMDTSSGSSCKLIY